MQRSLACWIITSIKKNLLLAKLFRLEFVEIADDSPDFIISCA